jgi:L-ascorbate metabolism protein UlaG (beta-lactamase superfamily)
MSLAACALVEPLINDWPAWSFLISPATASLHLLKFQIPVLESYLIDPALHVSACETPELRAGRFVNIPVTNVNLVAALLEKTMAVMALNIEFARSFIEFHSSLIQNAKGLSIEPLYPDIPEPLRGYVELVYDYDDRPHVRVLESMLYESPLYNLELQSLQLSALESDDSRQFFLNCPRVSGDGCWNWRIPFVSTDIDELFSPGKEDSSDSWNGARIRELIGATSKDERRLGSLFAPRRNTRRPVWHEPVVRIRYIGHACVLIEYNGISILTDPYVPVVPRRGGAERFTYEDLPEQIDFALVTHNHQDHFSIETLLRLRRRIQCLVVPRSLGLLYGDISLKLLAKKLGFHQVMEIDTFERIDFAVGDIVAVPFFGEHADIAHGKTTYVVRLGNRRIYFGADTDCLDKASYRHVRDFLGPIETVFLGMESVGAPLSWIYGPLLPHKPGKEQEEGRRQHGCNAARALELVEALEANRVFHYAMGLEPWTEHLLGLCLTENSPQLLESERMIAASGESGMQFVQRLHGKREFFLDDRFPGSNTKIVTAPAASSFFESSDDFVF